MTTWLGRSPDVPCPNTVAAKTQVVICARDVVTTWLPREAGAIDKSADH
jgi:hypothetical protein